jgi:hypothetical protein
MLRGRVAFVKTEIKRYGLLVVLSGMTSWERQIGDVRNQFCPF